MLKFKDIENLVDEGQSEIALKALDDLLEMGPKNVNALKLQAEIFQECAKFDDETKVWEKISKIDREDEDLAYFILRKQHEEREFYYFAQDLETGGRQFTGYSKQLVYFACYGLMGCMLFLIVSRLSKTNPPFDDLNVLFGSFLLFVIGPWIGILNVFFKCLNSVVMDKDAISFSTRTSSVLIPWDKLSKVLVARMGKQNSELKCILEAESMDLAIILEFHKDASPIRARHHFLKEMQRHLSKNHLKIRYEDLHMQQQLFKVGTKVKKIIY